MSGACGDWASAERLRKEMSARSSFFIMGAKGVLNVWPWSMVIKNGKGDRVRTLSRRRPVPLAADVWSQQQALDNLALHQVGGDDLINIRVVEIGVPDSFWVNHHNRPTRATIQASSSINPDTPWPSQPGGLDLALAMVKRSHGIVLRTTRLAVAAFIHTKKDVSLVVRVAGVGLRRGGFAVGC